MLLERRVAKDLEQVPPLVVMLLALQVPNVGSDLIQTTLPVPSLASELIAVSPRSS